MFFSLIQTLVCVLLIQGGLYALHLSGGSNNNNNNNNNNINPNQPGANDAVNHFQLPPTNSQTGLAHQFQLMQKLNAQQLQQKIQQQQQQLQQQHQQQQQHILDMLSAGAHMPHLSHMSKTSAMHKPTLAELERNGRLTQELADMAQMERERLMLLSMAKQANAAAAASAKSSAAITPHGRPIIPGRIQMGPATEFDNEFENERGYMFGSVVIEPKIVDTYEEDQYNEAAYNDQRHPAKYEYGRVVQPGEREREHQRELELEKERERELQFAREPEHEREHEHENGFDLDSLDFEDFKELEQDDDVLSDLEGYKYLEELLAEHNKAENNEQQHGHMLKDAPEPWEELIELEHRDEALKKQHELQQQQHQAKFYADSFASGGQPRSSNNIRLQQKWQRKRAQLAAQQPHLQRNIFGQHHKHGHFQQQPNLASTNTDLTGSNKNAAKTKTGLPVKAAESASISNAAAEATAQSSSAKMQKQDDTSATATAATATNQNIDSMPALNGANGKQQDKLAQQPNHKRSGVSSGFPPAVSHSIASQLMLRTARGQRQYDVPQIECPTAMDGMERFACPTPDLQGRYRCIDDHVLCDGFIDCPEGEDEDRRSCMFYKTTKAHLDVLADALLRWARGR